MPATADDVYVGLLLNDVFQDVAQQAWQIADEQTDVFHAGPIVERARGNVNTPEGCECGSEGGAGLTYQQSPCVVSWTLGDVSASAANESGGFAATAHAQLVQQVVNVILHGRHFDTELAGNLFVGEIPLQEADNFALAPRQAP